MTTDNTGTTGNPDDELTAKKSSEPSSATSSRDEEPTTLTGERSASAETGTDNILPTPEPTEGGAPAP
ncbi:hypothetical protein [Mycetocola zhujimingii]|nr:hypothetical protein [Mycetocola zhujimingii]